MTSLAEDKIDKMEEETVGEGSKVNQAILESSIAIVRSNSNAKAQQPGQQKAKQKSLTNRVLNKRPRSPEEPNKPIEFRGQQKTFNISINMDRTGGRTIRDVTFSGKRPPTYYKPKSNSQGPHIVAYSLMEAAIRGQLKGATLVPEAATPEKRRKTEKTEGPNRDAIKLLKNMLELESLTDIDGKIKNLLDDLEKEKNIVIEIEKNGDDEKVKKRVRAKLSVLRQGLGVATEDIVKLWNKRDGAVYQFEQRDGWPLKDDEIFGSDINSRENSAIEAIEGIQDQFSNLTIVSDMDGSVEDNAQAVLIDLTTVDQETIGRELSRLIDIKCEEEIKVKSLEAQYPQKKTLWKGLINEIEKEYNVIFGKSSLEAAYLLKLAIPAVLKDTKATEIQVWIKKYIKDASIETLEKRILSKSPKMNSYQRRLDALNGKSAN